ncbi:EscU/YscU/HrcU family type III secretion system export apparatus switch protein [Natranaerovirga pectinivora]|nr:EscU/YscU/HrcU family type III secretion system export apparatus switch protein [Natranaerovirga pectinivora]
MKKINKVAAIRYDIDEEAPRVLAKGKGIIADKLLQKAKTEDIPIYKDENLANELSKLDIGTYIPPELYEVVAEVLTFLDNLDQKFKK